jgi:hypothetical protein
LASVVARGFPEAGKEGLSVAERITAGPPAWVTKRDGRVEPFDADKICQALFAATETLGAPNAFLARELTDAVVHFLAADGADAPMPTAQLADRVTQVVRELGQAALAHAFAQCTPATPAHVVRAAPTIALDLAEPPAALARRCLHTYSEHAVFSRDLIAAQTDGLVRFAGLETPQALASAVVEAAHGEDLPARCAAAGQGLVLDAPEWSATGKADRDWLLRLPALLGRQLVVNLNAAEPPAWARQRGGGPLFADTQHVDEPALAPWLDALRPLRQVRWDWHLQGSDFTAAARDRLHEVARRALGGANVAFVFDRPRHPVALAEGMDRSRPAVLLEMALDLAAFLRLPGIAASAEALLDKLPTLARMAVSAGTQKRKYLRRHTEFGLFLLDRARLVVVPLGLGSLTGRGMDARHVVHRLNDHLQQAGRAVSLDVCLDSPGPGLTELLAPANLATAGLSYAEADADAAQQLRAAGALHAVTGQGTARVHWPHDAEPSADEYVELLQWAWRRTDVVRVIFPRQPTRHAQPVLEL